jgi:hypothetical protein
LGSKHPRPDRVKRSAPHSLEIVVDKASDAVAHLARGLIGESDGKNTGWIDAMMLDEAGDARSENARLSGACSSYDEKWAFEVKYCLALCGIEPREWLCITGGSCRSGGVQRFIHQLKIISNVAPRSDGARTSSPP